MLFEGNAPLRKLSSSGSINSLEESHFLQASLDLSDNASLERRMSSESNMSYYLRTMTPSAFESALRQKDGELASYMSRLVCISILLIFLLISSNCLVSTPLSFITFVLLVNNRSKLLEVVADY